MTHTNMSLPNVYVYATLMHTHTHIHTHTHTHTHTHIHTPTHTHGGLLYFVAEVHFSVKLLQQIPLHLLRREVEFIT